jgi:endonuclease-8
MPEGPTIVILKEQTSQFIGRKVTKVEGNTKEDKEIALGERILDIKSWGKHFLICFKDFTIKIHFMLFGSYRINETRDMQPRLSLKFKNGEMNFYACSVRILKEKLDDIYDWSSDVMSDEWDAKAAKVKLKDNPTMLVCDALLDQNIFAGSGNIIKNEVLFRIQVHPKSTIGNLPAKKLNELIKETRDYSFDFIKWKKAFVLRKHWLVHTKKICLRCAIPLIKEYMGKTNRRTFSAITARSSTNLITFRNIAIKFNKYTVRPYRNFTS